MEKFNRRKLFIAHISTVDIFLHIQTPSKFRILKYYEILTVENGENADIGKFPSFFAGKKKKERKKRSDNI